MRGKVQKEVGGYIEVGITPAHAGKSAFGILGKLACEDHPRACGEKRFCRLDSWPLLGSPPRMRGKAYRAVGHCTRLGITPAHAGKRPHVVFFISLHQDHPRACGEKERTQRHDKRAVGSPPRMRGKVHIDETASRDDGITPAHAGKSVAREILLIVSRDHPRACGEKTKKIP